MLASVAEGGRVEVDTLVVSSVVGGKVLVAVAAVAVVVVVVVVMGVGGRVLVGMDMVNRLSLLTQATAPGELKSFRMWFIHHVPTI